MELHLDNYIANKLVRYLGASKESWETFFLNLTSFQLEIENFFLDIFLPITNNRIPQSIKLILDENCYWLAIHFTNNFRKKMLIETKRQLYTKLH